MYYQYESYINHCQFMRRHPFRFGNKIEAAVIQDDVSLALPFPAQAMKQVHGDKIMIFENYHEDQIGHDAIICDKPGVTVIVKTADCIPLVIAEGKGGLRPLVAAVHAGWRSLTKDIIPKTIKKMVEMGAAPEDMNVGIGPSLGLECSEFSDPYNELPEKFHWAILDGNKVDLKAIALKQLEYAGVQRENISHMDICTKCDEGWFSFRRNGCKERFGTIISIKT